MSRTANTAAGLLLATGHVVDGGADKNFCREHPRRRIRIFSGDGTCSSGSDHHGGRSPGVMIAAVRFVLVTFSNVCMIAVQPLNPANPIATTQYL